MHIDVRKHINLLLNIFELMVLLFFVKEIYRIKLPGPAKLGEGKPENQNHAIIFTRGEALQTIDMNQVNIKLFC
jgi:hypothetical protein